MSEYNPIISMDQRVRELEGQIILDAAVEAELRQQLDQRQADYEKAMSCIEDVRGEQAARAQQSAEGREPVAKVVSGYSGDPDTKDSLALKAVNLSGCKIGDKLYTHPPKAQATQRYQKESSRLRADLDRALARVAELEADNLHQREQRNAARDCIKKMSAENKVTTLRKQAEAVESAIRTALRNLGNADISEDDIAKFASDYANRLRQQADQLEADMGEDHG